MHQVAHLTQSIKDLFNRGEFVVAEFIDFKNVYNIIWREIGWNTFNWFKNFLNQHWIRTKWRNTMSPYTKCIQYNFFLMNCVTYADAVILWTEVGNRNKIMLEHMESELNEALKDWSNYNYMIINYQKTTKTKEISLNINDNVIHKNKETTYLGIIMDNKLNFKVNIEKL